MEEFLMVDINALKYESVISDPKEYIKKIEEYISYIYKENRNVLLLEDAKKEFEKHILNFLLVISEVHAGCVNDEVVYIEQLFEIKDKEIFANKNLTEIMKRKNNLFENVPIYLQEMKRFANGTEYVSNILDCIINLGINFAAIDSDFAEKEARIIAEYKQVTTQKLIGFYNILSNDMKLIIEKGENLENNNKEKQGRYLRQIFAEFDDLIGLKSVKEELNTLVNVSRINKIRQAKKLPVVNMSKHLVFSRKSWNWKDNSCQITCKNIWCSWITFKRTFNRS